MLWSRSHAPDRPVSDGYLGLKGGLSLEIFCRRGERVFPVGPGDRLLPEDMIRFVPALPGPGYLMVISVDDQGRASLYYPNSESAAAPTTGERAPLPGSVILDSSEGPERIFLFYSRTPFEFDQIQKAITAAWSRVGALDDLQEISAPVLASQTSVLIVKTRKEETP